MRAPTADPVLVRVVYTFAVALALPIGVANVWVGVLLAVVVVHVARGRTGWTDIPADSGWYVAVYAWKALSGVAASGWQGLMAGSGFWERLPYPLLGAFRGGRRETLVALHLLALAHSLVILYALGERYLDFPVVYKTLFMPNGSVGGWPRLRGYSGHANQYAGALAIALTMTACVGSVADRRFLLYAPVLAIGLVLTASRSYLLGTLAGLGVAVLATGSARAAVRAALSAAAGLLLAWWLVPWFGSRMADAFSLARNAFRLRFWELSWKVFLEHPFLGVGPGNLQRELAPYADRGVIDNALQAHSVVLQELAEGGIVAGLLVVGLHVYFGAKYLRVASRARDALLRGAALGVAAAFVAVLFAGAFEDTFGAAVVALHLAFVMGVVESYTRCHLAHGEVAPIPKRPVGRRE